MATTISPPLNQIALSVLDLQASERFFCAGLGFLPSGGSRLMVSGPLASMVQGLPGAASTCWWLVGRNPWFQIEMFQFRRPVAQLMPADFRPCDIGYTRIGVHVASFDDTLRNLDRLGCQPLAPVMGEPGRRRIAVRSPDGVYVEIMEDDPLNGLGTQPGERACAATTRYVTMSTPDLDASVAYLSAIIGHGPSDIPLHHDGHEALWRLEGARCRRAVFLAGDVLIEVVQYLDPVGKPWPQGYRICDQGVLNIAFGSRNKRDNGVVYQRVIEFGATPNHAPINIPGAGVAYVNDPLGFSVEILWMAPGKSDREWGFEPRPTDRRPTADNRRVSASVRIRAPLDQVWSVLNDHDKMGQWIGFNPVRRIKAGNPDPNGIGAEREMKGALGTVIEQVTGVRECEKITYRVIDGSPFVFHNGEIRLFPAGEDTEVQWSIRFRSKWPLLGGLFRALMQVLLNRVLRQGLKPVCESINNKHVG